MGKGILLATQVDDNDVPSVILIKVLLKLNIQVKIQQQQILAFLKAFSVKLVTTSINHWISKTSLIML